MCFIYCSGDCVALAKHGTRTKSPSSGSSHVHAPVATQKLDEQRLFELVRPPVSRRNVIQKGFCRVKDGGLDDMMASHATTSLGLQVRMLPDTRPTLLYYLHLRYRQYSGRGDQR